MAGKQLLARAAIKPVEPALEQLITPRVRISETEKAASKRGALKSLKLNWEGVPSSLVLPEGLGTAIPRWSFPHGKALTQLSLPAGLKLDAGSTISSTEVSTGKRRASKKAKTTTTESTLSRSPAENRARLLALSLEEVEETLVDMCQRMTGDFVRQWKASKAPGAKSSKGTASEALEATEWMAKNISACTSFPWQEVAASPFALRAQALAAEAGLYAVNHELRGYPAERSIAVEQKLLRRKDESVDFFRPRWRNGQLSVPVIETYRRGQDRPLMVMYPHLTGKQSTPEAVAGVLGPYWHRHLTKWEMLTATLAAKSAEETAFYFFDDVLRVRDAEMMQWFKGTPLGDLYGCEGQQLAELQGSTFPTRGMLEATPAGGRTLFHQERFSILNPTGVFPRWVDLETLSSEKWKGSEWLRAQARLLQDGVRVFDRQLRSIRDQYRGSEPRSVYHPEFPRLAVEEEALECLQAQGYRFVGNRLYSLGVEHGVRAHHCGSSVEKYLNHVEAVVDRLLFQPITVSADKFFVRAKARTLADYLAQINLVPISVTDSETPVVLERLHKDAGEEIRKAFDQDFVIDLKKWRLVIPKMAHHNQAKLAFATGARKFADQGWDWCNTVQLYEGFRSALPISTHVLMALLWAPGVQRFPELIEGAINSEIMSQTRLPLHKRFIGLLQQLKMDPDVRGVMVDLARFEHCYRELNMAPDEFTPLLRDVERPSEAADTSSFIDSLQECSLALNPTFRVETFNSNALELFARVEEQWLQDTRTARAFTLKEQQLVLKHVHLANNTSIAKRNASGGQGARSAFHFLFGSSGTVLPVPEFLVSKWPKEQNEPLRWQSFQEMKTLLQSPASDKIKALLLTDTGATKKPRKSSRKRSTSQADDSATESDVISAAIRDTELWWLDLITAGAILVVRNPAASQ